MQICKQTGIEYTTQLHVSDLKDITKALGFNLDDEEGNSLLDYSPEGKETYSQLLILMLEKNQENFLDNQINS